MTNTLKASIYRGVVILPNTEPGYRLRYTARLETGQRLAAQTLAEIRRSIRDHVKGGVI